MVDPLVCRQCQSRRSTLHFTLLWWYSTPISLKLPLRSWWVFQAIKGSPNKKRHSGCKHGDKGATQAAFTLAAYSESALTLDLTESCFLHMDFFPFTTAVVGLFSFSVGCICSGGDQRRSACCGFPQVLALKLQPLVPRPTIVSEHERG